MSASSQPLVQGWYKKLHKINPYKFVHSRIVYSFNTWEQENTLIVTTLFSRRNLFWWINMWRIWCKTLTPTQFQQATFDVDEVNTKTNKKTPSCVLYLGIHKKDRKQQLNQVYLGLHPLGRWKTEILLCGLSAIVVEESKSWIELCQSGAMQITTGSRGVHWSASAVNELKNLTWRHWTHLHFLLFH